ncbi:hypothetical protein FRB98_003754 [Tulasnella sp. 332]|nr:hypothetical protein FRB98_003754 [Tulasnella sp. 332]
MKQILDSKASAGPKDGTFGQAFATVDVRFTHSAKGDDSAVVTDVAAYVAMCRGIAWQCYDQQVDINIIKNTIKREATHTQAEKLGFFSQKDGKDVVRSYITLTMELGVQGRKKFNMTTSQGTPRDQPKRAAKSPGSAIHPRFSIFATGCSSTVYDVVQPEEGAMYAQLLIARNLINEHPLQEEGYLAAIRRMKPAWGEGESFESSGLSWNCKTKT